MDRLTYSSFHHLQQNRWTKHGDRESIASRGENCNFLVYQAIKSKPPPFEKKA